MAWEALSAAMRRCPVTSVRAPLRSASASSSAANRRVVISTAERRQRHGPAVPVEEARSARVLERPDLGRDRRLADMPGARRLSEAARLRDEVKGLQAGERHR
jgi:hypothetical protein